MIRLFGRPQLGLALGGGGARAGAHLGVLRVLNDIGYRPDIITGTSMGGLIAAMFGSGLSLQEMEQILCNSALNEIIYPQRGGSGLLGTGRLADLLHTYLGNADLRDLSPKIAMIATDIRGARSVLLESGPAVQALLASMAVPGLFPPIEWGNSLLVDGGILNNVPTQAAYQLGADKLVAVDVSGGEWTTDFALENIRSFSTQLHRALYWLLSLSKRQAAFQVWVQSSMLTHDALTQYHLAAFPPDVLIQPDMPAVGLLSLEMIPATIVAGETAARAARPALEILLRRRGTQRRAPAKAPALAILQAP